MSEVNIPGLTNPMPDPTVPEAPTDTASGIRDLETSYQELLVMLRRDLQLEPADFAPASVPVSALVEVPYGVLSFAANQTASNGVTLTLNWDSPAQINLRGGMVYSSTGLTVPVAGLYTIEINTIIGGITAGGTATQSILINGTMANEYEANGPSAGAFIDVPLTTNWTGPLAAGAKVTVTVLQNGLATVPVGGTSSVPNQLSVVFLSNYA